jgi:divalent metal cation (Fe/Co/Zn/Cd) transporter
MESYKKFYDRLNTRHQLITGVTILIFVPIWMYVENMRRNESLQAFDAADWQQQTGLGSILLSILLVGIWHYQYHRAMKNIDSSISLPDKLQLYQKLFLNLIIRMAVWSVLIVILYYFLQSDALIAAYAIALVMMTMNRLTWQRIARQLRLSKEEREDFFRN